MTGARRVRSSPDSALVSGRLVPGSQAWDFLGESDPTQGEGMSACLDPVPFPAQAQRRWQVLLSLYRSPQLQWDGGSAASPQTRTLWFHSRERAQGSRQGLTLLQQPCLSFSMASWEGRCLHFVPPLDSPLRSWEVRKGLRMDANSPCVQGFYTLTTVLPQSFQKHVSGF